MANFNAFAQVRTYLLLTNLIALNQRSSSFTYTYISQHDFHRRNYSFLKNPTNKQRLCVAWRKHHILERRQSYLYPQVSRKSLVTREINSNSLKQPSSPLSVIMRRRSSRNNRVPSTTTISLQEQKHEQQQSLDDTTLDTNKKPKKRRLLNRIEPKNENDTTLGTNKKPKKQKQIKQEVKEEPIEILPIVKKLSSPGTPNVKKSKVKTKTRKSPSPKKKEVEPNFMIYSSDVAKIAPQNDWVDLNVSPEEFRPSATLTTGQCFNFIVVHSDNDDNEGNRKSAWGTHNKTEWIGPIENMVLSFKETKNTTMFRLLHVSPSSTMMQSKLSDEEISTFLESYFQLETPLKPLYEEWSKNDPRLAKIAPCIPGVRIIRQDPIECLFSFICSSNNNIPRITKMLSLFRETFGQKLIDIPMRRDANQIMGDGNDSTQQHEYQMMSLFSFPTLQELQSATEAQLRKMGLGYRAKYIIQTRDLLKANGGKDYMLSLRKIDDPCKVQEELLQYAGIGRKVADCVALFSLDQKDAIPVDVHVQHIASRDYDPSVLGTAKSLTPSIYKRVGDLFRDRFHYSGWAHSVLFVAELPSFRDVLPETVVSEMDEWREKEAKKKLAEKEAKNKKKNDKS